MSSTDNEYFNSDRFNESETRENSSADNMKFELQDGAFAKQRGESDAKMKKKEMNPN